MKSLLRSPEDVGWMQELREAIRTAPGLLEAGLISEADLPRYEELLQRYKFLLPRYYANLIEVGNPACPIRRQAVPNLGELEDRLHFTADPLADLAHQPASRITRRYRNRALIHLTANCSMYCRFCFRKSLLNEYADEFVSDPISQALDFLSSETEIEEVIFSGGDPLLASTSHLQETLLHLAGLDHVQRVRFHSRVPVTLPSRITDSLVDLLRTSRKPTILVSHFNHPREWTLTAREAMLRLQRKGITTLNQSVLLRGVNDDANTLASLYRLIFEGGVLPYYLHHPDRARGTSHFWIDFSRGKKIFTELRRLLPGYLVPRYVVDDAITPYKVSVSELE